MTDIIPRPKCLKCDNNAVSRGGGKFKTLCTRHHREKYNMVYTNSKQRAKKMLNMSKKPCSRCGWGESYTHAHRIVHGEHGGKYELGNVIPLCPNCHMIEHHGRLP